MGFGLRLGFLGTKAVRVTQTLVSLPAHPWDPACAWFGVPGFRIGAVTGDLGPFGVEGLLWALGGPWDSVPGAGKDKDWGPFCTVWVQEHPAWAQ